jgi:CBS domain-containing protein
MTTVKDCMSPKCAVITPDTNLADCAKIMRDQDIGFIPVGENDRLIGMVTDRDIVVKCVAQGANPQTATARDAMTAKTYYCFENDAAEDVVNNMAEIKVRRLPVVNADKRLVGVVSLGDLAQNVAQAQIGEAQQAITAPCAQRRAA